MRKEGFFFNPAGREKSCSLFPFNEGLQRLSLTELAANTLETLWLVKSDENHP